MSLAQFQEAFTQALVDADFDLNDARHMEYLNEGDLSVLHFEAQKNRTLEEFGRELGKIYPTVKQILSEPALLQTAKDFFYKHPPKSPHPVDSVEQFPYFLETHAHTKSHPFLPDIATIDLGYHKAYHAVAVDTIPTNIFTELPPEQLASKRIQLHPACFWFSSSFAIHDIWRLHHSPVPPKNIDYHWPQDVIIVRPHLTVEVHKIDAGFTNALDRLDAGETMEDAFSKAAVADQKFKPIAALQFLIQNNLIMTLY